MKEKKYIFNHRCICRSNINGPLEVSCGMRLMDINKIDSEDSTFSVTVAFKFYWLDNRVQINSSRTKIYIDLDFLKFLWIPDFYVYDLVLFNRLGVRDYGGLTIEKKSNNTGIDDRCPDFLSEHFDLRNPVHIGGRSGIWLSYRLHTLPLPLRHLQAEDHQLQREELLHRVPQQALGR